MPKAPSVRINENLPKDGILPGMAVVLEGWETCLSFPHTVRTKRLEGGVGGVFVSKASSLWR